jgi:hypothetical protein
MAVAKKKASKKSARYTTADGHSYLTKRITVSRAKAAGKVATENAMKVMGYVVVAQDNSIVKKYLDGRVEIIASI